MEKLHNINAENFKPNGLKQQFMKTFNEWKKQFGRAALIGTAAIGLAGGTMMFTGCPNPAGTTIDPDPIEKPDPIPQSKFETPRTKNFGDFVMYDFEGSKINITNSNVEDACAYYTGFASSKIDELIKTFSDDAKTNPLIQDAINRINNIQAKQGILTYHNEVERALAPIFQDIAKRNIELGDEHDRYILEGCCRYLFSEAYGHGLGDRINENRPETEKYQAEQKKAWMLANTNGKLGEKYGETAKTAEEAIIYMTNDYLFILSNDMSVPVKDLKTLFQMELINHATSPLFDLNKTWLGTNLEQTHCAVNAFSNPYATLSQTREQ
ncbi:MAG: hypothetical protein J5580_03835 [Clostridia bacterium]|nr:hypothetical protein [Clostridia bacterium]